MPTTRLPAWITALPLAAAIAFAAPESAAAQGVTLIRDTEIESTLLELTGPVFEAARMDPSSVELYIVQDPSLNAFVAGGRNVFLHTGLLMRTEAPGEIIGVVAHELGHIAGGHLLRMGTAMRRATAEAVLASVLGAAAAVAGAPDVGTALVLGGQQMAQQGFLRFNRSQEQQADQAAITYLDRAGMSARGLADFLRTLESATALVAAGADPYLQTHPLTRERIAFIENHVARSAHSDAAMPEELEILHARMIAKLEGFLRQPRQVVAETEGDDSLPARYARSIALFRLPDLARALAEIDALIADYPNDPYFHELKGQMLFENGRIGESVGPYREAQRLAPGSALIRTGLARSLVETGEDSDLREARLLLDEAVRLEPENAGAWRLLGIAHGRIGNDAQASLALAEYNLLIRRLDDARLHLRRAESRLAPGDPGWVRLEDVRRAIQEVER